MGRAEHPFDRPRVPISWWPDAGHPVGSHHPHPRRPRAQPPQRRPRAAARPADRLHRAVGLGQVVARVRHDLRRGPAPLRRVAVGVRPPVPRPDGQARRRLHRGPVAGDLDRPEVGVAQPALDRRHDHRDLRLPAPALRAHRRSRTARTAGGSSPARRRSRSSTGCCSSPTAPASRCSRRSCAAARASTTGCSTSSPGRASPAPGSTARSSTCRRQARRSRATSSTRSRSSSTGSCARPGIERRLTDSLETALRLAEGVAEVEIVPEGRRQRRAGDASRSPSTSRARTAGCRSTSSRPATSRSTRRTARASGATASAPRFQVDPELVVPDDDLSIDDGAIAPWSGFRGEYFNRVLDRGRRRVRLLDRRRRGRSSKAAQKKVVLYGTGQQAGARPLQEPVRAPALVHARGSRASIPWLERRHTEADTDRVREQIEGYMRQVPCPACGGARLRPASLAVTIGGSNIFEVGELSIARLRRVLRTRRALRARPADRRAGVQGGASSGCSSCSTSASTT